MTTRPGRRRISRSYCSSSSGSKACSMTLRQTVSTARSSCSAALSPNPSRRATCLTKSTTAGKSSAPVVTVRRATGLSSPGVPWSSVTGNASHSRQKSKIIHLPCLTLQLVAELGMGYAYKLACPLSNSAAAQLRHTVLGYHAVYYVLEGGDRRSRMELRHDARDRILGGGRAQHDEGLAVLGEERPAGEVWLTSRRRPVLAA